MFRVPSTISRDSRRNMRAGDDGTYRFRTAHIRVRRRVVWCLGPRLSYRSRVSGSAVASARLMNSGL